MIFGPNNKHTFTTEEHFSGADGEPNAGGVQNGMPKAEEIFAR